MMIKISIGVLCYLVFVLCFILVTTKYNFAEKTLHIPVDGILFKVRSFMNLLAETLFHPLVGLSINWHDAKAKATHMTSLCALYWKLVFTLPFAIFVVLFAIIATTGSGLLTLVVGALGGISFAIERIYTKAFKKKPADKKKLNLKVHTPEDLYKFLRKSKYRKLIIQKSELFDKSEAYLQNIIAYAKNPKKTKWMNGQAELPYGIKRILDETSTVTNDREWNIIFNYWSRLSNLADVNRGTKNSIRNICITQFEKVDKEYPILEICRRIKKEYDQRISVRIRRKLGLVITTIHSNMCPVIIQDDK